MGSQLEPYGFDQDRRLKDLLDTAKGARWAQRVQKQLRVGVSVGDTGGAALASSLPPQLAEPDVRLAELTAVLAAADPDQTPAEAGLPVRLGAYHWLAAPLSVAGDPLGWLVLGPRLDPNCCAPGPGEEALQRVRAGTLQALLPVLRDSLEWILACEYHRVMMSDLHLEVVEAGNAELVQANQRLRESEQQLQFVVQDLTRGLQEAAEETLRSQREAFSRERQASVGRLAAGIAHEINNPMAFVTSNLSTAREYLGALRVLVETVEGLPRESLAAGLRDVLTGEDYRFLVNDFRDLVDDALEGSNRVSAIVKALKDFSRIDSAERAPLDLEESAHAAVRLLQGRVPEGIEVQVEAAGPTTVVCHTAAVNQALMNLLDNALWAVGQGGTGIWMRCGQDPDRVWVEVEDDGPGIPEVNLPLVFDPFFTTREVGDGAGLGLTVAADTARAHGGGVEADAERPRGARFRLWLPRQTGDDP